MEIKKNKTKGMGDNEPYAMILLLRRQLENALQENKALIKAIYGDLLMMVIHNDTLCIEGESLLDVYRISKTFFYRMPTDGFNTTKDRIMADHIESIGIQAKQDRIAIVMTMGKIPPITIVLAREDREVYVFTMDTEAQTKKSQLVHVNLCHFTFHRAFYEKYRAVLEQWISENDLVK